MKRFTPTACLLALLGSAVPAAPASTSVDAARAAFAAAATEVSKVEEEIERLRAELHRISEQIQRAKDQRPRELGGGGALDELLLRSQRLSDEVAQRTRALSALHAARRGRAEALARLLEKEIEAARRAAGEALDAAARKRALDAMRMLYAERRGLFQPGLVAPALGAREQSASEDPNELRERADMLKDARDKVGGQLADLRRRLADAHAEAELSRRMAEFLDDGAIFDEPDRKLRPGGGGPRSSAPADAPAEMSEPASSSAPSPGAAPQGAGAAIAKPFEPGSSLPAAVNDEVRDIRRLEAERARLEALARDLDQRAAALEARAKELSE